MIFKQFKAVLFDMDGVVLDSMQEHAACWQSLLAEQGFQVDLEFILRHEGDLESDVLAELLGPTARMEDLDRARNAMPDLLARQADMYLKKHQKNVQVFPQVPEFLQALAQNGLPAALVTSSHRKVVRNCLPPRVLDSFSAVITAGDVRQHKPHPEPYLAAASALRLPARECLVIENAPAGIAAARAAGATCFAVTTTLAPAHLHQAQGVFGSLFEIGAFLGLLQ